MTVEPHAVTHDDVAAALGELSKISFNRERIGVKVSMPNGNEFSKNFLQRQKNKIQKKFIIYNKIIK